MARNRREIEYYVNENGCHICTSHAKTRKGYIKMNRDGFCEMHRWIYWKATGERPEVVMHVCNNPSCINIDHLKAGTQKDNMRHMAMSGNQMQQKLTPEQALIIFKDPRKQKEIAEEYGLHKTTISAIKRGKIWGHYLKGK